MCAGRLLRKGWSSQSKDNGVQLCHGDRDIASQDLWNGTTKTRIDKGESRDGSVGYLSRCVEEPEHVLKEWWHIVIQWLST